MDGRTRLRLWRSAKAHYLLPTLPLPPYEDHILRWYLSLAADQRYARPRLHSIFSAREERSPKWPRAEEGKALITAPPDGLEASR